MKKLVSIVFCLMLSISLIAQTEYQFKSTSQYFNSNEYTIQFAAQNLDGPTCNKSPRRAIIDNDPSPGYDPAEPTPIGDPSTELILIILLSYFCTIRKKRAIFFII